MAKKRTKAANADSERGTVEEPFFDKPAPKPVAKPEASPTMTLDNVVRGVFVNASKATQEAMLSSLAQVKIETPDDLIGADINVINASIRDAFLSEAYMMIEHHHGKGLPESALKKIKKVSDARKLEITSLFSRKGARELAQILQELSGNSDGNNLLAAVAKK